MDSQTKQKALKSLSSRLMSQSYRTSTRQIPNGLGYCYSLSKIFLIINLIILPAIAHATTVKVTVNQNVSSETASLNQKISAFDEAGKTIDCNIIDLEKKGRYGKGGKIQLQCLPYRGIVTVKGEDKEITTSRILFGPGPWRLKGQPALIKKGQSFYIEE